MQETRILLYSSEPQQIYRVTFAEMRLLKLHKNENFFKDLNGKLLATLHIKWNTSKNIYH